MGCRKFLPNPISTRKCWNGRFGPTPHHHHSPLDRCRQKFDKKKIPELPFQENKGYQSCVFVLFCLPFPKAKAKLKVKTYIMLTNNATKLGSRLICGHVSLTVFTSTILDYYSTLLFIIYGGCNFRVMGFVQLFFYRSRGRSTIFGSTFSQPLSYISFASVANVR